MNSFIIVCDNDHKNPEFNEKITSLAEKVEGHNEAVWNRLSNVWIINTQLDATKVRDALLKFFGDSDHFLVLGLDGNGAWNTDTTQSSNFIKHLLQSES